MPSDLTPVEGDTIYWNNTSGRYELAGTDLRVDKAGTGITARAIKPVTNNASTLGTTALRWSTVFGVNGNFSNNITVDGSTTLGNDGTDGIAFNARATTSFNPSVTSVYDLGSAALRWGTLHTASITTYSSFTSNGTTTIGDDTADTLSVNARVNTSIVPISNDTYNLGATGLRWNVVHAALFEGTATTARYADLAEKYVGDEAYEPGTVVVFGGSKEVTQSTTFADTRVAGVVSTDPAYLMNSALENAVDVALVGRVPCKVVGRVRKGDLLVTSTFAGHAVAYDNLTVGTLIGKALQDKDTDGPGVIEVVVGRT
jgi:hypothetical protein